jgi:chromosome segregation ATPase
LTAVKKQVDLLLSRIADTDERIAAIDARRKLIDEVQAKTNAIVHVLDDVRINLETVGEHKAVVDQVAEKIAQLEFMLQEARSTLRTLQHERELAERIRAEHQAVAITAPACRRKESERRRARAR